VFGSYASSLVPGDTNETWDVFRAKVVFPTVISGDDGDNLLTGGAADERLLGYAGADTLDGGDGNDDLRGGDSNDNLNGDGNADGVFGDHGRDTLAGGLGNDLLDGGVGSDRMHGGNGHDLLRDGNGFDTLIGGLGRDTLAGGLGNDVFVYNAVNNSPFGAGDNIVGFVSGQDRIDLRPIGAEAFIRGAAFTAGDGVIEVRFAGGNVQVDANDDGVFGPGDLEINGITSIAEADFILA
jgi:Ca2+-binding RTX toxin-like protein